MRKTFYILTCGALLLSGGFAQAATISGTVTDELTGAPVANAAINLQQETETPRTQKILGSPIKRPLARENSSPTKEKKQFSL